MAHEVHVGPPAVALHDLRRGSRVVHGVGRDQVLTVRRPGQTEDVGGAPALRGGHRQTRDRVSDRSAGTPKAQYQFKDHLALMPISYCYQCY